MKKAAEDLKAVIDCWNLLCAARPTELDFSSYGFGNANANHFTIIFSNWHDTLEKTIAKTRPSFEVDDRIVESGLARLLQTILPLVNQAHEQGFGWLLTSTEFLRLVATTAALISATVEKRITVRKELLRSIESKLNDDVLNVQKAAPAAASILDSFEEFSKDGEAVSAAKQAAEQSLVELAKQKAAAEQCKDEIAKLLETSTATSNNIGALLASLDTKVAEATTALTNSLAETTTKANETTAGATKKFDALLAESKLSAEGLLGEVKSTLQKVQEQKTESDAAIQKGAILIRQASEKLSKTLQDINRQALAGAFSDKALSIQTERNLWLFIFATSILALILVAFSNSDPGPFDWRNLLKALPFAGPIIWLGWFSARQAGMLSKIQQDYEYKAATAIAFDGYKKEVLGVNDEALAKQLLETAIRNFGDNPIRLYDGKLDNHSSPSEAIFAHMQDDKMWPRILEFIKAIKPELKK